MSRYQKLSHVIWFCQYHIVFVPKYRYRVLKGGIGKFVHQSIYAHTDHLIVKVPPKISISSLVGKVKGKTAIQAFQKFPSLRTKKYWGNHFWSAGCCVDTIGMDAEIIRKYVKYQDHK